MSQFSKQKEVGQRPMPEKHVRITAGTTLTRAQKYVYASTVSGTGAYTLTMRRPEMMVGQTVSIYMEARNGTDDITISGEGFSDITLDAAGEWTVLYSIGEDWVEIGSNHA